jgi:hypothetical protein
VDNYNKFVGSFERNVMASGRRLRDKGIEIGKREIEDVVGRKSAAPWRCGRTLRRCLGQTGNDRMTRWGPALGFVLTLIPVSAFAGLPSAVHVDGRLAPRDECASILASLFFAVRLYDRFVIVISKA